MNPAPSRAHHHVHQQWQTSPDGRVRCGLVDCHQVFAHVCPDHRQRWGATGPTACPICGGSGLVRYTPSPSAWADAVRQVEATVTVGASQRRSVVVPDA